MQQEEDTPSAKVIKNTPYVNEQTEITSTMANINTRKEQTITQSSQNLKKMDKEALELGDINEEGPELQKIMGQLFNNKRKAVEQVAPQRSFTIKNPQNVSKAFSLMSGKVTSGANSRISSTSKPSLTANGSLKSSINSKDDVVGGKMSRFKLSTAKDSSAMKEKAGNQTFMFTQSVEQEDIAGPQSPKHLDDMPVDKSVQAPLQHKKIKADGNSIGSSRGGTESTFSFGRAIANKGSVRPNAPRHSVPKMNPVSLSINSKPSAINNVMYSNILFYNCTYVYFYFLIINAFIRPFIYFLQYILIIQIFLLLFKHK